MVDDALSPRQRQIAELILQGLDSKEIGRSLKISPNTVDDHCRALIARFGATNRRQAARAAADAGLLSSPQRLRRQSSGIPDDEASQPFREPQHDAAPPIGLRDAVHDMQRHEFRTTTIDWPIPTADKPRNRMRPVTILAWAFALAIGTAVAVGAIVNVAEGIARMHWAASS